MRWLMLWQRRRRSFSENINVFNPTAVPTFISLTTHNTQHSSHTSGRTSRRRRQFGTTDEPPVPPSHRRFMEELLPTQRWSACSALASRIIFRNAAGSTTCTGSPRTQAECNQTAQQ